LRDDHRFQLGDGSHFAVDQEQRSDYQLMRALDLLKGWQIFQGLNRPAA
jgi:carboxyl-terminal processing protease